VVQSGATAYVLNRSTGGLVRVDGATFEVSPPAEPIPRAADGLQVFASGGSLFVLDGQRGVVTHADARTLSGWATPMPMAGQVGRQAAVSDDAERLWVLDGETGDLLWVDHGKKHLRRGAADGHLGLLTLADDAPVVVDPGRHSASLVDPRTGSTRSSVALDVGPDDQVQVVGDAHATRVYVVARGVLEICELTAVRCAATVPLNIDGGDFGAPVEAGGRLFVPDYATGQVWIVDLRRSKVVAQPRLFDPKVRYQLLTRDGVVFFNDPNSERAGVVRLDGGVTRIGKYDPRDPDKGLTQPPAPPSASSSVDTSCGAFRDDFSAPAVDPRWGLDYGQFVDQRSVRDGWLTLVVKDGADLFPARVQAPMLTRPLTGSYTISARVRAEPTFSYQSAGLVLFAGADSYVRLEIGAVDKGGTIAFEYRVGGGEHHKIVDPFKGTVPTGSTTVELRLTRQGDAARGAWRRAGSSPWQELGAAKVKTDEAYRAGVLMVNNSQSPKPDPQKRPFAASFDYVEATCGTG
jgi:regulation of enolase protein 1 (concanavalin A-like superfamily)